MVNLYITPVSHKINIFNEKVKRVMVEAKVVVVVVSAEEGEQRYIWIKYALASTYYCAW